MEEATLFEHEFECIYCNNSYSTRRNRDRHIKTMHKEKPVPELTTTKTSRIRCILCTIDQVNAIFSTYKDYNKHLEDTHQVIVHVSTWSFTGKEEYDLWREKDKRDVNYAYNSVFKSHSIKRVYYNCNRTDSIGFQSTSKKRMSKKGGTIKISGSCPSRMIVSFEENGRVRVKFFETHVGHEEEVRAQQLSKKEQIYLVDQLKAGVHRKIIISNARNFNLSASGLPGRLNTINTQDLRNLSWRYNVGHIRHQNDKIATAMKVDECNANGKICHDHEYSTKNSTCKPTDEPAMPELIWHIRDTIDEHDVVQSASVHNRTEKIEEFLLKKRTSTQATTSNRQRQISREHWINFVNEMCAVDENTFDVFQGDMNSFELKWRRKLEQITKKKKLDQQYFPDKKSRL